MPIMLKETTLFRFVPTGTGTILPSFAKMHNMKTLSLKSVTKHDYVAYIIHISCPPTVYVYKNTMELILPNINY